MTDPRKTVYLNFDTFEEVKPRSMTIRTINEKPYTLNVLSRLIGQAEKTEIETTTFATAHEALSTAREEVKWEGTVHATVTDERTGEDIFDEAGWAPIS